MKKFFQAVFILCNISLYSDRAFAQSITFQKSIGRSLEDYANSVQQTNDGGYLIASGSSSQIMKTDAMGNIIRIVENNYEPGINSISATNDNGFVVAGITYNPDTMGNIFLAKLDSMVRNYCDDSLINISVNDDTLNISGTSSYVSSGLSFYDFTPIVGSGGNSYDLCFPSSISGEENFSSFNIFPNPSSSKISFSQNFPNGSIQIFNILGENVYSGKFEKELDVSFLTEGIYIIDVATKENNYRAKFVKE